MQLDRGRPAAALALIVALSACGPSKETLRQGESAVAAAARAKTVAQAGEVMATRREAQPSLDSARMGFVAKDAATTANALRSAALFARRQADSAAQPAKTALANSANEFDRLAGRFDKSGVTALESVTALDAAFARMQLAEAQLHCTRALDAWKQANAGATSSEMVMLADHFERGAKDGAVTLDSAAQHASATIRAVALKLGQGATVTPSEVDSALNAMDKEVHDLMAKVAKLPGSRQNDN